MALTVATNTGALMAQAAASSVNKDMELSMERLATGKRINGASDDAAGVAIASRLTSEIKGTNQAIRNAMDGQALIDTAEGAHQEIESILQRMRELAVQASNDTNDANDRANLQLEMDQLVTEIDRISSTTSWAGQTLMDGTGTFSFQVGSKTTSGDTISTSISSMSANGIGVGTKSVSDITVVSGGSLSDGTITFTAGSGATQVKVGNETFTLAQDIAAGTGNTLTVPTAATDIVSLTAGTATGVNNFTVNGVTIEYAGNATAATAAAAMVVAFDAAKTANPSALNHLSATATSAVVDFSSTGTEKRDALNTLMAASTSLTADFNLDATVASKLTLSANNPKADISVGTNTNGSGGTGGTAITAAAGQLTLTTNATIDTATVNNTINVTVEGITVAFNTYTDGVAKGYNGNSSTSVAAQSLGDALIQKLEDAGVKGVNMSNTNGVITLTKGGAASVTTQAAAQDTIERIDNAIKTVNSQRATLGAVSNRLDSTVSNLTNISSNLQAGRGRIEDADFASETTSLAKSQILQQASTAMLAQANASKQNVLSLLQG